jgi:hypothetical protein
MSIMQKSNLAKTASKYESIGDWFTAARRWGYSVPLPLCHGLSQCMSALGLSFPKAFALLVKHDKFILVDKSYIYDFSADRLWQENQCGGGPKPPRKGIQDESLASSLAGVRRAQAPRSA